MNELLDYAKNICVEYLETLDDRPVYPDQKSLEQLKMFGEALPLNPSNTAEVISYLHKYGSPSTVASVVPLTYLYI
jgi:hypothetical protein